MHRFGGVTKTKAKKKPRSTDNMSDSSEERQWVELERKKRTKIQRLRVMMMNPSNSEEQQKSIQDQIKAIEEIE